MTHDMLEAPGAALHALKIDAVKAVEVLDACQLDDEAHLVAGIDRLVATVSRQRLWARRQGKHAEL